MQSMMEADCVVLNRREARRVDRGMGLPRNRVKGGSVMLLGAALRLNWLVGWLSARPRWGRRAARLRECAGHPAVGRR